MKGRIPCPFRAYRYFPCPYIQYGICEDIEVCPGNSDSFCGHSVEVVGEIQTILNRDTEDPDPRAILEGIRCLFPDSETVPKKEVEKC